MKIINFNWNIKEKPEFFIVKEKSYFEKGDNFFLYLLIKKNYNTKELAEKLNFSYAGLKDKRALTMQYISSKIDYGELLKNFENNRFFIIKKIGKIRKKIKVGYLIGNYFFVYYKNTNYKINKKELIINYYDLQRLENNWERGLNLVKQLIENEPNKNIKKIKKNWMKMFLIDCFLSYLWNESLKELIKNNFDKENLVLVKEKDYDFLYLEKSELINKLPKYWPILGYKIKENEINDFYLKILENHEINLKDLIDLLKKLGLKGDYRKVFVKVEEFKKSKRYLKFFLPKGSYATNFLKQIIF